MTEREAFEQWFMSGAYGQRPYDRFDEKEASEDEVYEVWQAALAYRSEQASQGQVPEGWQIVPKEPTVAMLCELNEAAIEVAGMRHGENADIALRRAYAGMLAAAPLPHKEGE